MNHTREIEMTCSIWSDHNLQLPRFYGKSNRILFCTGSMSSCCIRSFSQQVLRISGNSQLAYRLHIADIVFRCFCSSILHHAMPFHTSSTFLMNTHILLFSCIFLAFWLPFHILLLGTILVCHPNQLVRLIRLLQIAEPHFGCRTTWSIRH